MRCPDVDLSQVVIAVLTELHFYLSAPAKAFHVTFSLSLITSVSVAVVQQSFRKAVQVHV